MYTIYLISYSILRKIVRPLIILSFNPPNPLGGLDALFTFSRNESIFVKFLYNSYTLGLVKKEGKIKTTF